MSTPDNGETEPGPRPAGASEWEALRQRVVQLEAGMPGAPEHHRLRATGSAVLIVVAAILSLLAVISVWARDQVTNTDRFVATMGPLASHPEVQAAVSAQVTKIVVQQIDVSALVGQLSAAASQTGVPPQAAGLIDSLTGPIGSGITSLIGGVVDKVVTSDAFATTWTNVITAAHGSMVKALTGQGGGIVSLENNQVTVDLAPVIAQVKTQLVDAGLGVAANIPTVHTQFVVYESTAIGKAKNLVRVLDVVGNWMPFIAAAVAAAGVYLARNRRRALVGAAFGIGLAMLVLGVALAAFRGYFISQLPPGVNTGAAGAVYDALVHFLRQSVRMVGVLAVLVMLGAFFVGPTRTAVFVRAASTTGIIGVRQAAESIGFRAGPVEPFVRRFKRWIGVAILLIASVIFVLWDHPTGTVVFWFAVVILAFFAVREFLAPGPGLAALRPHDRARGVGPGDAATAGPGTDEP